MVVIRHCAARSPLLPSQYQPISSPSRARRPSREIIASILHMSRHICLEILIWTWTQNCLSPADLLDAAGSLLTNTHGHVYLRFRRSPSPRRQPSIMPTSRRNQPHSRSRGSSCFTKNMSPVDYVTTPTGGTSASLKDWLWDNYRIFVLLLPARTSEYNPIELIWNILAQ